MCTPLVAPGKSLDDMIIHPDLEDSKNIPLKLSKNEIPS